MIELAYFTFLCVCFWLFSRFPLRISVGTSVLVGELFLPVAATKVPLLLLDKEAIIALALLFFGLKKIWSSSHAPHWKWIDFPMILWCVVPFFSSWSNDLGFYDGVYGIIQRFLHWGVFYFLGAWTYGQHSGLLQIEELLWKGGLLYVPFCLYELRFSPQLHRILYGYHQHSFQQMMRYEGYRPMVFMSHGLMVGMWLMASTLAGYSIALKKDLPISRYPVFLMLFLGMIALTLFIKSFLAATLLCLAILGLALGHKRKTLWVPYGLMTASVGYGILRALQIWSGKSLIDLATQIYGSERAQSLEFRLLNENLLIKKAWERLWLGWGGWNRGSIFSPEMQKIVSTYDGLWTIALSENGLVGLFSVSLIFALPSIFLLKGLFGTKESQSRSITVLSFSILMTSFMVDNLFNALINPFFILICGALSRQSTLSKPVLENESTNALRYGHLEAQ